MTWRSATTVKDRLFGCLPYLLPLMEVILLGFALASRFNIFVRQGSLAWQLMEPLLLLIGAYQRIPFGGFLILILLIFLVIRNTAISHFIRFNTMQAILLYIALYLGQITLGLLSAAGSSAVNGIQDLLLACLALCALAAIIYSVVQTARGLYAEIPAVSQAVYMRVQ